MSRSSKYFDFALQAFPKALNFTCKTLVRTRGLEPENQAFANFRKNCRGTA